MSLFKELKRRNVFRMAIAYLVISWLLIQVIGLASDSFDAPTWVMKMMITLLVIGFFPTLLFSWAFELTEDGIKKESEILRDESIANITAKKLDTITLIAGIVIGGLIIWQQFNYSKNAATEIEKNTAVVTTNTSEKKLKVKTLSSTKMSRKSIAVLPFTNMSSDEKNKSFTLGIHDDLLTHLSKISALKVISRTSVLRYKNTEKPIIEIAKELGVNNILEGSVQSSGKQIRINVQLIDAKTDEHLWAEIYDRKLNTENIFNIQTEIATKIAAALKAELSVDEQHKLAKQPTNNLDAYNAYIAGRQRMLNRNSQDLKAALKLFQRAAQLDPNFALAYVNQADVINLLNEYSDLPIQEMFAQGEPLIEKALQLDPQLAEAHTSKANYLLSKGKFKLAEKEFQYAIQLNPNYATSYHWYGRLLEGLGRSEEYLAIERKALMLDPLSPVIQTNIAYALLGLGRYQEAEEQIYRTIELAPKYSGAAGNMAGLYFQMGKLDRAVFWQQKAVALDTGNLGSQYLLGIYYLSLGDIKEAKTMLSTMKKRFHHHLYIELFQLVIYIANGELERAYKVSEMLYHAQPDNNQLKISFANMSGLVGQYKQARDLYLSIFADNKDALIKVNAANYKDIIGLALAYKKLAQKNKLKPLISQLKKVMSDIAENEHDISWVWIEILQDKNQAAVDAYTDIINQHQYKQWWIYEQSIPEKIKKLPGYIKANQQLMDNLQAQRQNLIALESAAPSP